MQKLFTHRELMEILHPAAITIQSFMRDSLVIPLELILRTLSNGKLGN